MKRIAIEDKYNKNKVWHMKKSKCSHFYYNQSIKGYMVNSSFQRITKKNLDKMLDNRSYKNE